MRRVLGLLPALAAALLIPGPAVAREPVGPAGLKLPPGFDPDQMADPKVAAAAADWLEREYPAPAPGAVRMLVTILRGNPMDGKTGWFGPAESRYTWEWLAARSGTDPKAGAVARDQFRGPPALFDRLDRNGDGKITPADLDWTERSPYVQQATGLDRLFRRWDTTGDGKLTREELDGLFRAVSKGKDGFTAEDLRDAMIPRGRGGMGTGDGPTVPVLVRGFLAGDIGSMSDGPRVGDPAPDFALKTPDGKETVRLADLVGTKPVVLVFGNFTCGPFRGLYPDLEAIYRRHKDAATFLTVYVREAHPTDGWGMASNGRVGVAVAQPKTLAEREQVCGQFCRMLRPEMPVVVDDITDPAGTAYSGMPGRMYVLDPKGVVAYKSGRGPFGFRAGEVEQALSMALLEAGAGR